MRIRIERVSRDQAPVVQKLFESAPDYFIKTENSIVKPHFAEREMSDSPPLAKQTATYEKRFCLIFLEDEPIGIVDLHKDHPVKDVCYIGLFLLKEDQQKKGLGREIFHEVESYITERLHCAVARLGVSEANDVEKFWLKMGFARNGNSYIWKSSDQQNQVFEMEKALLQS